MMVRLLKEKKPVIDKIVSKIWRRKSLSLELNSHAPSKQFFVKKLFFKIHTPYFQGKFTKAVTSCTHSDAFKFAAKNSQPMQGQSANPDLFVSVSITARWPPVLIVWIQLLCLRRIRNRFNCLVESKPVKQEVSCRYSESSPLKVSIILCLHYENVCGIALIWASFWFHTHEPLFIIFKRALRRGKFTCSILLWDTVVKRKDEP